MFLKNVRHGHIWLGKAQIGQILTWRESMRTTVEEDKCRGIPQRFGTLSVLLGVRWTLMGLCQARRCALAHMSACLSRLPGACHLLNPSQSLTSLHHCWTAGSIHLFDSQASSYQLLFYPLPGNILLTTPEMLQWLRLWSQTHFHSNPWSSPGVWSQIAPWGLWSSVSPTKEIEALVLTSCGFMRLKSEYVQALLNYSYQ